MEGNSNAERARRADAAPVVMADVARVAGVSKQTVSRVLNDVPVVNRATRERVLATMRELGYQPNSVARALATGRTGVFGVLAFDTVHYGPAKVLQGIDEAANDAGYLTSVAPLRSSNRLSVRNAVERLLNRAVDGLITIAPHEEMAKALLDLPRQVPIVAVDGSLDETVPVVTVDEVGGARSAVEHLLSLGHHTVTHLAGPATSLAARGRTEGWRAALEAAGRPVPAPLVGDWEAGSGFALGRRLAEDPAVTAVFAANDQMAIGLLRAMYEHGRAVPEAVSVVGFDDIPESAHLIPPLSTVRPDFAETGRRCISVLLEQLKSGGAGSERAETTVIPCDLVVRRSSGAAPARG